MRANAFELEALEPRLLLSADGMTSVMGSGSLNDRDRLLENSPAVVVAAYAVESGSLSSFDAQNANSDDDIFDVTGQAMEQSIEPVATPDEGITLAAVEPIQTTDTGASGTEPVAMASVFDAGSDSAQRQVETLNAANGPPPQVDDLATISANSTFSTSAEVTGLQSQALSVLPAGGAGDGAHPMLANEADVLVPGFSGSLQTGLTGISRKLQELFDTAAVFGSVVPGILETQGAGADSVETSPTVRQLLDSPVDVSASAQKGASGLNGFGFYPGGGSLADRYLFISVALPGDFSFSSFGNDGADERALDAMDVNGDGTVTWKEAFDVLIGGQTIRFLNTVDLTDIVGGSNGVDEDDLAAHLNTFFNSGLILPGYLSDRFDLAVSSSNISGDGDLKFRLNLLLSFDHSDTIYLGYDSEQLGIVTNPTLPGSTPAPTKVPVDAGVHFRSLIIGFTDVAGGVTSSDFIFAVPDKPLDANDGMVVSVEIDSLGTIDSNGAALKRSFDINIGFLGARVTDGKIQLDMDLMGGTHDPSNPDALGFSLDQQGASSASGVVTAAEVPEPLDFRLANDVIFTLKVGTQLSSRVIEVKVTKTSTDTNANLTDLIADLAAAILTANADLAALISATAVGGKIRLSLPTVNPGPLGFAHEASGLGDLIGAAAPIIGSTTPGAISFLLSVGGAVPKLITFTPTKADHDSDVNTPEQVTIGSLVSSLNAALAGTGVTAANNGGGALLLSGGGSKEITRTLTLDTVDEITLAELATGQLFDLDPQPGTFSLDFSVVTKSGLQKLDNSAFAPVGTIKLNINPWDSTKLDAVVVDRNPINGNDVLRARFDLTDAGGLLLRNPASGSDMQPLLDFNVITTAEVLSLVNQLANWLARLSASELFNKFDIPFADLALGKLLDFRDLVTDTLLIDDFDMDLGAFGSFAGGVQSGIEVEGKLKLTATGQLRMVIGILMGNAAVALVDGSNLLLDFNTGVGVAITAMVAGVSVRGPTTPTDDVASGSAFGRLHFPRYKKHGHRLLLSEIGVRGLPALVVPPEPE